MFRVEGVEVKRVNPTTIRALLRFFDNRVSPEKPLFDHPFEGTNKAAIKTKVDAMLARMKQADDEAAENAQHVNTVIATDGPLDALLQGLRQDGGTYYGFVQYFDTRRTPKRLVKQEHLTGPSRANIRNQAITTLAALRTAEDNSGLNDDFLGQTISSI